jgi:hypothetical protein
MYLGLTPLADRATLSAGQFRDKREQLSASFLSRFQQVTFAELPAQEWEEVLRQLLAREGVPPELAAVCAQEMLRVHTTFRASPEASLRELRASRAPLLARYGNGVHRPLDCPACCPEAARC